MIYRPRFLYIQYFLYTLLHLIPFLNDPAPLFKRRGAHLLERPQPAARPWRTHPPVASLLHKRGRGWRPRATPVVQLVHQTHMRFIHVPLEQGTLLGGLSEGLGEVFIGRLIELQWVVAFATQVKGFWVVRVVSEQMGQGVQSVLEVEKLNLAEGQVQVGLLKD